MCSIGKKEGRCYPAPGMEKFATRGSRVNTVQVVVLAQQRSLDILEIRFNDQSFLFGHRQLSTNSTCNENQLKSLGFG